MFPRLALLPCAFAFVLITHAHAADTNKKDVFTDPKFAGEDFVLQGEYSGEVNVDGKTSKAGVQVIALGNGRFRAVGYPGGLPGDGWNQEKKHVAEGTLKDGKVEFKLEGVGNGVLTKGALRAEQDGQTIGTLKKIVRTSPTLGKKPPEGAVMLFDGSTADHFKGGRLSDDGLLMVGVTSKRTFGSFTLHMEFLTPFMPKARGQGRGNSGCYLQGRYEVQILDSFGLAGKHNECGGIYETRDPAVNMCFPPLSWQTYDIEFTAAKYNDDGSKKIENARMTVKHNGVVVHKNVELPKGTRANPVKEGPGPGPVYLQNHGNPVRFRNIWVVEKKS